MAAFLTHAGAFHYLLLREPWVNNKHDAINGQRGLSNVGGHHHLPTNGSIRLLGRG